MARCCAIWERGYYESLQDIDGDIDTVDRLGEPHCARPEREPEGQEPTASETTVRPAAAGRKEQEERK